MRWRSGRRSDNVVEARSGGARGGLPLLGGMSLTGLLVAMGIAWMLGINPMEFIGLLGNESGPGATSITVPAEASDEDTEFVRVIIGSTEDVWHRVMQANGRRYQEPQLVLYTGSVATACGAGSSAMGPFYCPGDHRAYLDLSFFNEMKTRFRAGGDFAQAYVIAHEIGHHVQNLIGVFEATHQARQRGARMEGADGLSVRQELQADCFAGLWAHHAQAEYRWLEPGDVEKALAAANAIGDDALQRQSRGHVVPDSFTHGTSEQRQRWFMRGFETGEMSACDSFGATRL